MGLCGSAPAQPDYAAAEYAGAQAAANALPLQKQIEAAAQRGEKVTVNGKEYDFSGLGDAEYQSAYADAMAQAALEVQKQYGPEYIKQRMEELKAADPAGYAARQELYQKTMGGLDKAPPGMEDATALQESVLADLKKGGELHPEVERRVREGVLGGQVSRGNWLGGAAQDQEASAVVDASDKVAADRQARALQYLQSGSTPDDITYRDSQQDMANLHAFLSGETPTAQFSSLSGAGNGAAPMVTGSPGVGINYTPGSGSGFASNVAGTTNSYLGSQANPWMAGISTGISALGTYQSLKKP